MLLGFYANEMLEVGGFMLPLFVGRSWLFEVGALLSNSLTIMVLNIMVLNIMVQL
jgi:hypothetical protein